MAEQERRCASSPLLLDFVPLASRHERERETESVVLSEDCVGDTEERRDLCGQCSILKDLVLDCDVNRIGETVLVRERERERERDGKDEDEATASGSAHRVCRSHAGLHDCCSAAHVQEVQGK